MASRNYKPCAKNGCPNLTMTPRKYCEEHHELECKATKENNRLYNVQRGDVQEQQFYKSKDWARARNYRLALDHGLCQCCLKDNIMTKATIVHHIVDLKTNWDLRLVAKNLESVCSSCHNKKHDKKRKAVSVH